MPQCALAELKGDWKTSMKTLRQMMTRVGSMAAASTKSFKVIRTLLLCWLHAIMACQPPLTFRKQSHNKSSVLVLINIYVLVRSLSATLLWYKYTRPAMCCLMQGAEACLDHQKLLLLNCMPKAAACKRFHIYNAIHWRCQNWCRR